MLESKETMLCARTFFLRRIGIFRDYDEEDIFRCTDLLDMYCPADAGIDKHKKFNLVSVQIWASVEDVAVHQHRISANDQIGAGNAMLAVAEMV